MTKWVIIVLLLKKFADILSGKKPFVLLGYPEKETARLYNVNARAKIILKRSYALHMDNSGHFAGQGYGTRGHRDPAPLSLQQITNIPAFIKTARADEIIIGRKVRNLQRYKIIKQISKTQIIVIEVNVNKNGIYLVTAYNVSKKRCTHNRVHLLSRG